MKSIHHSSLCAVSLLLVGNLFFSSCDKDKDEPETVAIPLMASAKSYDQNGELDYSESYQYDNQGRIIKVDDNEGYITTMEYSGSTVIVKDSEDGELKDTSIGQIDSKGLCTSMSFGGDDENSTYVYDTDGYRKSSSSESQSTVITSAYTVSEGNYVTIISTGEWISENSAFVNEISSFKRSFLAANLQKRITTGTRLKSTTTSYTNKSDFQFYPDKTNTIGFENMGISFMGKQDKNPVKQQTNTITYDSEVAPTQTITYTYEYDAKGRITKQTSNDGDYMVYTYVD